jgi:hypothetical protein
MARLVTTLAVPVFLMVAVASPSQTFYDHVPQHLRGPWTDHHAAFGSHEATLRLPEGWSIQEGGIAVSESERQACQIAFVPTPGAYDEALARALAADREESKYTLHSELCCGSERHVVSVQYADAAGNTVEKRYFVLRSSDGSSLVTLKLTASPTPDGRRCEQRFEVVANSFRIELPRQRLEGAPPN